MRKKKATLKLDCKISGRPIGKYLLKLTTTKYNRAQVIISVKKSYVIQWQNIKSDIIRFFKNPFEVSPQIALSLFTLFIFLFSEEKALQFFVIGALTKDSATESNNTSTFNVTVAVNDNRIMILGLGHYQGGDGISGATYNSDALTQIKKQDGSYGEHADIWGLVAPDTGTNSFVVSGRDSWMGFGVLSVYDSDQNIPTNTAGYSGSNSSVEGSLTTTVDNAWVVAAIGAEPAITMSTTSGVEDMNEQGDVYQNAEMHHVAKATAGSQNMTASLGYGARWNMAQCELKPFSAPAATPKNLAQTFAG